MACTNTAVDWTETSTLPYDANAARLALDSTGRAHPAPRAKQPATRPSDPAICAESIRTTQHTITPGWSPEARRTLTYAVWWSVRADSSAALLSATSRDGGATWTSPVPVDTADRARRGCDRPAPDIVADGEYVHVTYALEAPEGIGVFYAHSMDEGALYHWPTTVAYGVRLTHSAVAASGDRVVVAYEDPARAESRIGLVLSRTQGHIFERRIATISTGARAARPQAALLGDRVAITWDAGNAADSMRTLRAGRIR